MPATRGIKEPCYKHVFSLGGECSCSNCRKDAQKKKPVKKSTSSTPQSSQKKTLSVSTPKSGRKMSPNVVIERLSNEALRYFDDVLGYSSESEKEEIQEKESQSEIAGTDVGEAQSDSVVDEDKIKAEDEPKTDRPKIGYKKAGKFKLVDVPSYEEVYGDNDELDDNDYTDTCNTGVQTELSQKQRVSPLVIEQTMRQKVEKLKTDIAKRHLVIGVLKRNIRRKRKVLEVKEQQTVEVRKRVMDFLNSGGEKQMYDLLQRDSTGKVLSGSFPLSLESDMSVDEVIRTVGAVFPKENESVEKIKEDAVVPLVDVPFNIFLNKSKYDAISMFVENGESAVENEPIA